MLNFEDKKALAAKVWKHLNANQLWVDDVSWDNNLPVITVDISWGDWKHEHRRCDLLLEELLPNSYHIKTEVTEEDGSDTYSATHYYLVG